MSSYISKVAPVYKDWQFQSLTDGINKEDWLEVMNKFDNLQKSVGEENRYNLYSIQNSDFFIHLWHNSEKGNAITFSHFPERFLGEFIKYIKEICYELRANLYTLNNNGIPTLFDFSKYTDSINKHYSPLNESKVTNVKITEMMGFICIPSTDISNLASYLKFHKDEITSWDEAVQKCYNSNGYMIRTIQGWTIVIGQLEPLVNKFSEELNQEISEREQFFDLLKKISKDFEKVSYTFNASKYSHFENVIAENGQLTYLYIHSDGDEEIEGEFKEGHFNDFLAFSYDKSILKGIQLYI